MHTITGISINFGSACLANNANGWHSYIDTVKIRSKFNFHRQKETHTQSIYMQGNAFSTTRRFHALGLTAMNRSLVLSRDCQ